MNSEVQRTELLQVRLKPIELKTISAAARDVGLTRSEWCRTVLLRHAAQPPRRAET